MKDWIRFCLTQNKTSYKMDFDSFICSLLHSGFVYSLKCTSSLHVLFL